MKKLSFIILIVLVIITSKFVLSFMDISFITVIFGILYYSYSVAKIELKKVYKKL